MIDINGLRVNKRGRTICAVPELKIAGGERVSILGRNGAGKTTLLRVLSELEADYVGDCRVDATWRERVYVHQTPYLFRGTVLFNVTYGLRERGIGRDESKQMGLHRLEQLGLDEKANQRVTHLSGGERRRVALARAMILQPRLLLLDEPLADLDAAGSACVVNALDELADITLLVASPNSLPKGWTTREYQLPLCARVDSEPR